MSTTVFVFVHYTSNQKVLSTSSFILKLLKSVFLILQPYLHFIYYAKTLKFRYFFVYSIEFTRSFASFFLLASETAKPGRQVLTIFTNNFSYKKLTINCN